LNILDVYGGQVTSLNIDVYGSSSQLVYSGTYGIWYIISDSTLYRLNLMSYQSDGSVQWEVKTISYGFNWYLSVINCNGLDYVFAYDQERSYSNDPYGIRYVVLDNQGEMTQDGIINDVCGFQIKLLREGNSIYIYSTNQQSEYTIARFDIDGGIDYTNHTVDGTIKSINVLQTPDNEGVIMGLLTDIDYSDSYTFVINRLYEFDPNYISSHQLTKNNDYTGRVWGDISPSYSRNLNFSFYLVNGSGWTDELMYITDKSSIMSDDNLIGVSNFVDNHEVDIIPLGSIAYIPDYKLSGDWSVDKSVFINKSTGRLECVELDFSNRDNYILLGTIGANSTYYNGDNCIEVILRDKSDKLELKGFSL
jgi:hypothetical protein